MSEQQTITQTGSFRICGADRPADAPPVICIADPGHAEGEHNWCPYARDEVAE